MAVLTDIISTRLVLAKKVEKNLLAAGIALPISQADPSLFVPAFPNVEGNKGKGKM